MLQDALAQREVAELPKDCPDPSKLQAFHWHTLAHSDHEHIKEHVAHCDSCSLQLAALANPGSTEIAAQPSSDPDPVAVDEPQLHPSPLNIGDRIGDRYEVQGVLGAGEFGRVYLCKDPKLDRDVAVKVLNPRYRDQIELLEDEAQHAAAIEHPGIVVVHDVDTSGPDPYIVQVHIPGQSLKSVLKSGHRFPLHESIELVVAVAEALSAAHEARIFHRDLKPSNILIDDEGEPRLIDFGLSIRERDQHRRKGEIAGSRSYMSPEQSRGESHRVDDRSDIWSLCVILYELVVERLPFGGATPEEIFAEIQFRDPTPPRQLREIPAELERIILKGLSKRMADRYPVCRDLIDDLRTVQLRPTTHRPTLTAEDGSGSTEADAPSTEQNVRDEPSDASDPQPETTAAATAQGSTQRRPTLVIPRGLLSFTASDWEHYPLLLPGPYDRRGLPNSITFWLERLGHSRDTEPFAVGLIYGPSGSGKSSLMRAGVLPRLPETVVPVYADCAEPGTERHIRRVLRENQIGSPDDSLAETLRKIRIPGRTGGRKVLLVLDQFEQWLHGRTEFLESELTLALRHCDGVTLQAILVVRDDFWMGVSRFMHALEIPVSEGHNAMALQVPGKRHSRRVLERFGMAYGGMPQVDKRTADHEAFLDKAINQLAKGSPVSCVALALFAHIVRDSDWTASALAEQGGVSRITQDYLQNALDRRHAPLALRRFTEEARTVLGELLPDDMSDITGHSRDYEELRAAARLAPDEFDEMMNALGRDLALIATSDSPDGERRYRISHDHIVKPIRDLLTAEQRKTMKGRARVDLQESAARWQRLRNPGLLPSLSSYFRFRVLTRASTRTAQENEYLEANAQRYLIRAGFAAVAVGVLLVAATVWFRQITTRAEVMAQVEQLIDTDSPDKLDELAALTATSTDALSRVGEYAESGDTNQKIRAWYVRTHLEGEQHPDAVAELITLLGQVDLENALGASLLNLSLRRTTGASDALRQQFDESASADLQARCAVMLLSFRDMEKAIACSQLRPDPTLRSTFTLYLSQWFRDWRMSSAMLAAPVDDRFKTVFCNALSLVWNDLPREHRNEIRFHAKAVLDDPDPSVQSAALHLFEVDGAYQPRETQERNEHPDWRVTTDGIRLLRLGRTPDSEFRNVFLADRETSNGLFKRFLDDPRRPQLVDVVVQANQPEDFPAERLTLEHIAQFCNWLSDRDPLPDGTKRTHAFTREPGTKAWRMSAETNGYRLPLVSELDHAARAGTTTDWHCMSKPEQRLFALFETSREVARTFGPGQARMDRCGSRLPNPSGFFDLLGNAGDAYWPTDDQRPYYGGTADDMLDDCQGQPAAASRPRAIPAMLYKIGFRVAVTDA